MNRMREDGAMEYLETGTCPRFAVSGESQVFEGVVYGIDGSAVSGV
jgi:hypothetical protein